MGCVGISRGAIGVGEWHKLAGCSVNLPTSTFLVDSFRVPTLRNRIIKLRLRPGIGSEFVGAKHVRSAPNLPIFRKTFQVVCYINRHQKR
jgi:hypothetical protein